MDTDKIIGALGAMSRAALLALLDAVKRELASREKVVDRSTWRTTSPSIYESVAAGLRAIGIGAPPLPAMPKRIRSLAESATVEVDTFAAAHFPKISIVQRCRLDQIIATECIRLKRSSGMFVSPKSCLESIHTTGGIGAILDCAFPGYVENGMVEKILQPL